MKIRVALQDPVIIYQDDEMIGSVSYEMFCLKVLSPRSFRRLERNPGLNIFDVRRIDLDQALAGHGPTLLAFEQPF
jgi:hypothetical protein